MKIHVFNPESKENFIVDSNETVYSELNNNWFLLTVFAFLLPLLYAGIKEGLHNSHLKREEARKKSAIKAQSKPVKIGQFKHASNTHERTQIEGLLVQKGKWFEKQQSDVTAQQLEMLSQLLAEYEAELQQAAVTEIALDTADEPASLANASASPTTIEKQASREIRVIAPIPTIHPKAHAENTALAHASKTSTHKIISWGEKFPRYNLTANVAENPAKPVYRLRGDGHSYIYLNPLLLAFLHKHYSDAEATLMKLCDNGKSHIAKKQSGFLIREASNANKLDKNIHQKKKVKQKNSHMGKAEVPDAPSEHQSAFVKAKDCSKPFRFYGESVASNGHARLFQINRFKPEHKKNGDVFYFPSIT